VRKFVFLAAAATAFAFVALSPAQAQIVTRVGSPTPHYGEYSSGYPRAATRGCSPYRYGGSNHGIVQSGYSSFGNYGVYPSYYGGYSSGYRSGYSGYNSSSFYRGSSYGNSGGYFTPSSTAQPMN
jgi:hypothetical protein